MSSGLDLVKCYTASAGGCRVLNTVCNKGLAGRLEGGEDAGSLLHAKPSVLGSIRHLKWERTGEARGAQLLPERRERNQCACSPPLLRALNAWQGKSFPFLLETQGKLK